MGIEETRCPSCGRFVGAYEKCPYCGANIPKRLSIKLFRYGSLIFSFIGLAILYFISVHREIPLIKINEISPTMNFAYIRVKGTVSRYPIFDEKLSILTIYLNDGTEDIMVKAYRVTAKKLRKLNKVPQLGDIMDVEGTVRIRGALKILTINVPERVRIIKPKPLYIKLSQVSDALMNKLVSVTGIIADARFYRKYISLFITDIKGKNRIKIPLNLNVLNRRVIPRFDVGYKIRVTGIVSYYAGNYNIMPISAESIKIISTKITAPEYRISSITSDDIDRIIKTKGKITKIRRFSKGVALTISDNDSYIDVVLWNNVYNSIPNRDDIEEGAKISVIGKVGIYRGRLQIVPKRAKNFKILEKPQIFVKAPEPVKTKEIPLINITSITTNDLGKIVKIKGDVTDYYDFSKGRKLTVEDATGSIEVVLWNNVLEEIPEAEYLLTGAEIAVTGKVSEYRGELQIIPKYSDQIEIIKLGKIIEEELFTNEIQPIISTNQNINTNTQTILTNR